MTTERFLFFSPHLDDAVFACGEAIASSPGAIVATVFAGRPPARTPLAPWDADAGFRDGDDVIGTRRREDREALALLGASPHWLDFRDDQYGRPADRGAIADAVAQVITEHRPRTVLFPLGLFHSDHRATHEAALAAMHCVVPCRWIAYEDAIYRRYDRLLGARIAALEEAGLAPTRVTLPIDPARSARKRQAVDRYRSQLKALATPGRPGHQDAFAPEGYWRVGARSEQ